MIPKSFRSRRSKSAAAAFVVACIAAGCAKGSGGSPTSPSGTAPPPPPNTGSVQVSINPNPVPFSGQPITDTPGCATLKNTWFYDQVFKETAGVAVTLTARVDSFDGFVVNNLQGLAIDVPAGGTLPLHARWCSGNPTSHTAQSTFSGVDSRGGAVSITTPTIRLQAP